MIYVIVVRCLAFFLSHINEQVLLVKSMLKEGGLDSNFLNT